MYRRLFVVMVGLALLFSTVHVVMAADAPAAAPMNPKVKAQLDSAKASIKKVSAEDAKKVLDAKEKVIFLDVRDPGEFSAGHLPGAMNISRGTLEFVVFNQIPDQNAKIYVYCKTTGRSTLATRTLNDLGYKNAVLVDVQYADWVKAGYPVER
ncbi:MAG TPA: rhodanese-like domain-containing protein [Syntrophorhabdales bacterium]|nr:rhodanese-like domain-containing protein [Syntrophorhabdales bacterium]